MIARACYHSLSAASVGQRRAFPQAIAENADQARLTPTRDIAYDYHGPADCFPVLLMHGFPYDPRADASVPPLRPAGYRSIVPISADCPNIPLPSNPAFWQQAASPRLSRYGALSCRARAARYDWGGRALWRRGLGPERVRASFRPWLNFRYRCVACRRRPTEHRLWYQYYSTQRGGRVLQANRLELCKLLWRLWSPNGHSTTRPTTHHGSFDNPDFRRIGIHAYRHVWHARRSGVGTARAASGRAAEDNGFNHRVARRRRCVNLAAGSATQRDFFTRPTTAGGLMGISAAEAPANWRRGSRFLSYRPAGSSI